MRGSKSVACVNTHHHACGFQLDPMTLAILILELGVVAGNDATLPRPGILLVRCRNQIARVNVQVLPKMGILSPHTLDQSRTRVQGGFPPRSTDLDTTVHQEQRTP